MAENKTDIIINARKRLSKSFEKLCNETHQSAETLFDHFLEFVINGWSVGGAPLSWWPYNKTQTQAFQILMAEWMKCLQEILTVEKWYDLLGYLYEQHVAGILRKRGAGQFFTPHHVCELMAVITDSPEETTEGACLMTDPCCGSGRLMLAAHAIHPEAHIQANDLDRTCCMMTVCNMLVHACVGVVTRGNGLIPGDIKETWAVNSFLNDTHSPLYGVPHIIQKPN